MSEQKHTPEPWAAYQDGKIEFGNINHFIKSLAGDLVSYGHLSKDDARRIVACVNWCAGNSTKGMELAVEIGRPYSVERDSAIERELEVTKQRDDLLAVFSVVISEMEDRDRNDGNAPGHGHKIPGIWDSDNGSLSGKPCAWCAVWAKAKELIASVKGKPMAAP